MIYKELQKVKARNDIATEIYQMLKEMIISGGFPPGTRLVETQIASQLGVSRTPVREAFLRLWNDGFLRKVGNRTIVERVCVDHIKEVFAVRQLLEGYAARLAAQRIGEKDIVRLEKLHHRMTQNLKGWDQTNKKTQVVVDLNQRFHSIIYENASNAVLNKLINSLREYFFGTHIILHYKKNDLVRSFSEHEKIIHALKTHNEDVTENLFRQHLQGALTIVSRTLQDTD